jgi:hypothetical protein
VCPPPCHKCVVSVCVCMCVCVGGGRYTYTYISMCLYIYICVCDMCVCTRKSVSSPSLDRHIQHSRRCQKATMITHTHTHIRRARTYLSDRSWSSTAWGTRPSRMTAPSTPSTTAALAISTCGVFVFVGCVFVGCWWVISTCFFGVFVVLWGGGVGGGLFWFSCVVFVGGEDRWLA